MKAAMMHQFHRSSEVSGGVCRPQKQHGEGMLNCGCRLVGAAAGIDENKSDDERIERLTANQAHEHGLQLERNSLNTGHDETKRQEKEQNKQKSLHGSLLLCAFGGAGHRRSHDDSTCR